MWPVWPLVIVTHSISVSDLYMPWDIFYSLQNEYSDRRRFIHHQLETKVGTCKTYIIDNSESAQICPEKKLTDTFTLVFRSRKEAEY
ncbi:hypothetical protein BJ166DRAFT_79376 [Pestalotiopsis sp. NC0098]|nr:hypothetical protein BJ166DRAFT_79376 [Pestalotiopsis sp. NC0098]